jgi:DNA end-binding protein Ku
MAPRPYWKGYLKLSLVSCAVALYATTSSSGRIAFHWLNRQSGNRLRQQMIDPGSGEAVEPDERVRGYALSKTEYLTVEEEELDAIEIESSHTIDIESFVRREEIDPVYFDNAYYLAPDDKVAEEAYTVIREAMAEEGVAGLGRAVIARRERLMVLEPRGKGMLATALHYASEVRSEAVFDGIADTAVPGEMLDLAKHIIRGKMGRFDISKFTDRYEDALVEMIRAKQAGRPVEAVKPRQPSNVINLMDALRKSIAADKQTDRNAGVGAGREAASAQPKRLPPAPERKRQAAAARPEPKRTEGGSGKPSKTSGAKAKPARKAAR